MARRSWPGSARQITTTVHDPHPISVSMVAGLLQATALTSPMTRGRFRQGLGGVGSNRDDRDVGALQDFRGQALVARRMDRLRAGAQGGPSQAPAYPSTGTTARPSVMGALAGMDLPEVLR